jgi:hypothetical protein
MDERPFDLLVDERPPNLPIERGVRRINAVPAEQVTVGVR